MAIIPFSVIVLARIVINTGVCFVEDPLYTPHTYPILHYTLSDTLSQAPCTYVHTYVHEVGTLDMGSGVLSRADKKKKGFAMIQLLFTASSRCLEYITTMIWC